VSVIHTFGGPPPEPIPASLSPAMEDWAGTGAVCPVLRKGFLSVMTLYLSSPFVEAMPAKLFVARAARTTTHQQDREVMSKL
jgi:hypothetical protein